MAVKLYGIVLALSLLINILICESALQSWQERVLISQFHNYVNRMERMRDENMLNIFEKFLRKTEHIAPFDESLFRNDMAQLELNRPDLDFDVKMERLQNGLDYISMVYNSEPLATSLIRALLYEYKQFRNKVLKGAKIFRSKFSGKGRRRNAKLFGILSEIEQNEAVLLPQMEQLWSVMAEEYELYYS